MMKVGNTLTCAHCFDEQTYTRNYGKAESHYVSHEHFEVMLIRNTLNHFDVANLLGDYIKSLNIQIWPTNMFNRLF